MSKTYIGSTDLLYTLNKIKNVLEDGYVAQEEGKGLSSNDFTDELKSQYDAAQANVLESVKVNGTAQTITEKGVDITIPTKTSDITNDSNFITTSEVKDAAYSETQTIAQAIAALEGSVGEGGSVSTQISSAIEELDSTPSQSAGTDGLSLSITQVDGVITAVSGSIAANTYDSYGSASAIVGTESDTKESNTIYGVKAYVNDQIGNITSISYTKVSSFSALPETGATGTIYLVPNSGSGNNIYDEYIWSTDNKYEKIGTTEADLTGYIQESDLTEISTTDIDTMFTTVFGSVTNAE